MSGEANLIITADGLEFDLSQPGMLVLLALQGYGMPRIEYQAQRGYGQHGQTALGYRLQPRTMTLFMYSRGRNRAEFRAARERLYEFLRPNRGGPLTLRKVREDGSRRDIQARWQGGANFAQDAPDSPELHDSIETVELVCDDPTFYDPAVQEASLLEGTADGLIFPATFGTTWLFKGGTTMGQLSITYTGTWRSYPTLIISGPYDWMRIVNNATGASLYLGVALAEGKSLTIDLTPGQQSITDEAGENHFSDLYDGNLIDFYLMPSSEGNGGVNILSVYAAGREEEVTTVTVQYYTRYIAI